MKPLVSIIPEPDRSTVERKPLTEGQRAALALAQGGLCGCGCGVKLDHLREGTIDEHLDPLALTGTNDLSNRSLYRKPCALAKTKDDIARIAKAKAQGGETGQVARRERRGCGTIPARVDSWPPKGSVKLQSAGFPKKGAKRSVGTKAEGRSAPSSTPTGSKGEGL